MTEYALDYSVQNKTLCTCTYDIHEIYVTGLEKTYLIYSLRVLPCVIRNLCVSLNSL